MLPFPFIILDFVKHNIMISWCRLNWCLILQGNVFEYTVAVYYGTAV